MRPCGITKVRNAPPPDSRFFVSFYPNMKILKNLKSSLWGRAAVLALCGSSATMSLPAIAAPVLKQGASAESALGNREEMVAGFIVKPHHKRGAKLVAALSQSDASGLSERLKLPMMVARRMSNDAHVLRTEKPIPLSEAKVIAARMMRDGEVELAEPDRIVYPAATPQDPSYSYYQWHYKTPSGNNLGGANLPPAWDYALGKGVTVAVLDTGYRPHPDFASNILPGYDFITNTTTANDGNRRDSDARDPGDWVAEDACGSNQAQNSSWHGTHVIGTIAALMDNGKGGTGVAPNVKILPLRVLGKCGGATSDIADAMRWAAGLPVPGLPANPYPARVLNLSLGGKGSCSATFQSAVNDVVKAGKIIVASTGNDSVTSISQPANCDGVLAVTAHAVDGDNAYYSNLGPETFISAPGGGCGTLSAGSCDDFSSADGLGIYSTGNTGTKAPEKDAYALMMGTSMAAPHVAGTIALMLSKRPHLTLEEIKFYLKTSSRPHPVETTCTLEGYVNKCGSGLLDAGGALKIANTAQITAPHKTVTLSGNGAIPSNFIASSESISYSWTALPNNPEPVTLIDADQLNASFTAPSKSGLYAFKLQATDSTGNVEVAIATVRVNSPPKLDSFEGQTVEAGDSLDLHLTGTDRDGNTLLFYPVSLPPGASLSESGHFHWASATPVGTYQLTYYASDGYEETRQASVSVKVASSGGGGGGSMDDWSLIGLLLLSFCLRLRPSASSYKRELH